MTDQDYMERALHLAERGRGRTSPNPMVGAIVVSDGVVVGGGYHRQAGRPHAEPQALARAGGRARGATLYCTLEPCCHMGRTGPCVEHIVQAGIRRVVAAMEDPNPLVGGGGVRYLRDCGIQVEIGVHAERAALLNRAFVTSMTRGRPFIIMKIAMSVDGRISARGTRSVLTSGPANRRVHLLRAEVDAIAIGSETLLVDDPILTVRGVYRARPLTRVVFDRRLRTPATARLFSTLDTGPVIIVTTRQAVEEAPERTDALLTAGAQMVTDADGLEAAVRRLADAGVQSLLLEGGARLHAAAWAAGIVDRVEAWVAPHALGPDALAWMPAGGFSFSALRHVRSEVVGPDVLIEGDVHRAD
jgi:diaminohydroxyphosphoribosylaminopyrimidine deaminase / 5-amino-6-(5-phosphoribosylamino)uracil reductase